MKLTQKSYKAQIHSKTCNSDQKVFQIHAQAAKYKENKHLNRVYKHKTDPVGTRLITKHKHTKINSNKAKRPRIQAGNN